MGTRQLDRPFECALVVELQTVSEQSRPPDTRNRQESVDQ